MKKWLAAEAYADAQAHDHGIITTATITLDRNRHDEHIASFVLTSDAAIPAGTLDMFLELVRATLRRPSCCA